MKSDKYEVIPRGESGYIVTEHGHTMFPEDVKQRLDRFVELEARVALFENKLMTKIMQRLSLSLIKDMIKQEGKNETGI